MPTLTPCDWIPVLPGRVTAQLNGIAPLQGPSMSPLALRNAFVVLPQAEIFAQTLVSILFFSVLSAQPN